ncbi:hypothetical protein GI374_01690 [Paracoccus sp. S-4012]|uniref:hypothetical protein n=1 Tax=Paracoccus sp. S-4012 TaxID=2665648 RepID=UPI0012AF7842|nr:hypothetical protein [Paracoccus sp. S-4012]MRX49171.1 hypothetical protein [Paracoccus sp. S-4012]
MAPRVEHDLHRRRRSRNLGLLVVLLALVALIIGMTMVRVSQGNMMKGFDHRMGDLPPPVVQEGQR